MSARRTTREPYRVRRDRREVLVAVAVAALIVLVTVVAVWILAPDDESTPSFTPPVTASPTATSAPTATTTPEGTAPAGDTPTTATPSSPSGG